MITLPSVQSPIYEDLIPSTGETFYYRPFVLKEYKALLQCIDNNSSLEFINTTLSIIDACTFNKLNINKLTVFDIDYMLIKIRTKSVSDIVPIYYQCQNVIIQGEEHHICGQNFSYAMDLNKMYVKNLEFYKKSQTIELAPNLFIKMRAPSFEKYRNTVYSENYKKQEIFNYAYSCVESIIHEDRILLPDLDFTHAQFEEFIDNLPTKAITGIIEFIQNIPTITMDVHFKCPKCQKQYDTTIEGLNDFFR